MGLTHPPTPLTEMAGPTTLLDSATTADRSHPIRVVAVRVPPPLTPVVPAPPTTPTTPTRTHVGLYDSTLPDRTSQALPDQDVLASKPPVNSIRNTPPAAMKRPHHVHLLPMHLIRLTQLGEGPPALSDVT